MLAADLERRIQAVENKCCKCMLGISYRSKTNECVWKQVNILAGHHELLLSSVKRRKLPWFGHICHHNELSKIILYGRVDDDRRRENRINHLGQHQVMVIVVAHRRRQKSANGHCSAGVCRSTPTTPGRHGCKLVIVLVALL